MNIIVYNLADIRKEQQMTRQLLPVLIGIVMLAASLLGSAAQAPQGQGRGQAAQPAPQGIDVAAARRMVAAAEAAAVSANAKVAIAVVDANGDLVYFERMDGASARAVTSSQGKARAALLFGLPTKDVQDAMNAGKPVSVTVTNPAAGAWEITVGQGGLPVVKDGKVVAAIGCGGSLPANDEKFAQAGINAMATK
jgi:glc operon protein GlcG